MGSPIQEPQYGDDCGFLTPGVFPVDKNPLKMLCTLFDIVSCPFAGGEGAPNGSAQITQVTPCYWQGDIQGKTINYTATAIDTRLSAVKSGNTWFADTAPAVGADSFTNDLVACGGISTFGVLGTGQVLLEPYEANSWEIAVDFNFLDPAESYFTEYMLDTVTPFTSVTRLSSHRWNTNILIKRER